MIPSDTTFLTSARQLPLHPYSSLQFLLLIHERTFEIAHLVTKSRLKSATY